MTATLLLLMLLGSLGAFDTLYFHEWRARLPSRGGGIRTELHLHAARDFVYTVIFATLPWVAWHGAWTVVLCVLVVLEIVLTMRDFVVEDRVRAPLGGVSPGERVMHAAMAIVYGVMLASLAGTLSSWFHAPTGLAPSTTASPVALKLALSAMAFGILLSGLRDLAAAQGMRGAAWPWPPPPPDDMRSEATQQRRGQQRSVMHATDVVPVAVLLGWAWWRHRR
jgi:hypothetical protein